jgi:hypothetical protein
VTSDGGRADDGHRHGAESARDQIAIRLVLLVHIAHGERHAES